MAIDITTHEKILKQHLLPLYPATVMQCMKRMTDRKTKADKNDYLGKAAEHNYDCINYFAMRMQVEPKTQKMLAPRLVYLAQAMHGL